MVASLEAAEGKLREAKSDNRELERDRVMNDCLDTLKRLFPGKRECAGLIVYRYSGGSTHP